MYPTTTNAYVNSRLDHDGDPDVRSPTSSTEAIARITSSPHITNTLSYGGSSLAVAPGRARRMAGNCEPAQATQARIANRTKTTIDQNTQGGESSRDAINAIKHACHKTFFPEATLADLSDISFPFSERSQGPDSTTTSKLSHSEKTVFI